MKINVKVFPRAREEKIIESRGEWRVFVKAPAREGKANERVLRVIAAHFHVPLSAIRLISGRTSRFKTFNLP